MSQYETFLFTCLEDSFHAVREGVDRRVLEALTPQEREDAEQLLLPALREKPNDQRPIEAVAYLKLTSALPILYERLANTSSEDGLIRIVLAWALHYVDQYPAALTVITETMQTLDLKQNFWSLSVASDKLQDFGRTYLGIHTLVTLMIKDLHDLAKPGYSSTSYSFALDLQHLFLDAETEGEKALAVIFNQMVKQAPWHDYAEENLKLAQEALAIIEASQ